MGTGFEKYLIHKSHNWILNGKDITGRVGEINKVGYPSLSTCFSAPLASVHNFHYCLN